ncbi:hypothetical protein IFM89_007668, partial [Coptis chinensis]
GSLSRWELCRDVKELKNIRRFKLALELSSIVTLPSLICRRSF